MKITWISDSRASCWHAVLAAARGLPLVDEALAAELTAHFAASPPDAEMLREQAGAAIANPDADTALAALAIASRRLAPTGDKALAEELRLRGGPLREQWDARGLGLLRQIGRVTEPLPAGAAASVALVAPAVGGHGEAFPADNLVTFEAVLANPITTLPEVLRLAWLLARLSAPADSASSRLALIPAVLTAGEEVELASLSGETLEQALAGWHASENPLSDAATLLPWWNDYRGSLAPWAAAVADLAERLR